MAAAGGWMRGLVLSGVAIALSVAVIPPFAWGQQTTAYTYDALGRLTAVLQSGGPVDGNAVTYNYDAAGNRTNYLSTSGAAFSVGNASANEGSSLSFLVTRAGTVTNSVTVNYATSNGTAVAGANYTATSGTLSFAAGVTSQAITVPTKADGVATSSLTMTLTLSSPSSGAQIAVGGGTGTIVNTDAPAFKALNPTLNLSSAATSTITLSSLAATNSQAAKITAFSPTGGTATISTDKQSISYVAPTIAQPVACDPAVKKTYTAPYTVQASDGSQAVSGTMTIYVTGPAGAKPKPPAVCP